MNGQSCDNCNDGEYEVLSNTCVPKYCLNVLNNALCDHCGDNTTLTAGKCSINIPGCIKLDSNTYKCINCDNGYFMNDNSQCIECGIENCYVCVHNNRNDPNKIQADCSTCTSPTHVVTLDYY